MVTLGREQPISDGSTISLTPNEEMLLREPLDSEMPLHIQEALSRERQAIENQQNWSGNWPTVSKQPASTSEMNGQTEVTITPL
jgi:hypothetical protein